MRKQLRSTLIVSAALILLAMSPSWAAPGGDKGSNPNANPNAPGQVKKTFEAPEIDVGAGGAGIAVLVIALLLAAERRSRSS